MNICEYWFEIYSHRQEHYKNNNSITDNPISTIDNKEVLRCIENIEKHEKSDKTSKNNESLNENSQIKNEISSEKQQLKEKISESLNSESKVILEKPIEKGLDDNQNDLSEKKGNQIK